MYYCREDIRIGLNISALYRMLRNLTTSGYTLEFSVTDDSRDYLNVIISNSEKRTQTRNKLKLLRLPEEEISIPSANFQRVLSIPSGDFQRYVRELSSISPKIKIKSTNDKLILSASGTMGSTEISIRPTSGGMHWLHMEKSGADEAQDVEGIFLSKYLGE